ncbi:hypothetical protein [Caldalkalibacillus mannanilyticus]|uniref:hypothetical protein n=1 Tax=Caldalkalibacillus mannanilyticus TaxID=1418 RepID=UPI0004690265|nr:hypothetical protein [Caldalkalibacillus mannanilyticus]
MYQTQGVISQIQNTLQQMQMMESQNANQLRQLARHLEEIAQHENAATHQLQELNQLCNQLVQETQRITNQSTIQQTAYGVNQPATYAVNSTQPQSGVQLPYPLSKQGTTYNQYQ